MTKLEEALKRFERAQHPNPDFCPTPIRYGQDEQRCQACGLVWGVDEDRPACQRTGPKED